MRINYVILYLHQKLITFRDIFGIENDNSSLGEIGKHGRLKICSLWVAGSSPAASIIELKNNLIKNAVTKERWLSGQRHLTVNQTTFVYVGSNPTLSRPLSSSG